MMHQELSKLLSSNGISEKDFYLTIYDNLVVRLFVLVINEMKDEAFKKDLKRRMNSSLNKNTTVKNILFERFGCSISDQEAQRIYSYLDAYFRKKSTRALFGDDTRNHILSNQNSKCSICGTNIRLGNSELDHIIPWEYVGDELGQDNLQMLCKECNRRKGKSIDFGIKMFLVNRA